VIAGWARPGVVALVKELYDLSDDNRRFLHARLLESLPADYHVEDARRAIEKLVNPTAVYNGRFRHADVKRVVEQYAKASGNDAGLAELLIGDLEATLETFRTVGDYEALADHALWSLDRLHRTLEAVDADTARRLVESLAGLAERFRGAFGWGVSDELAGLAAEWRHRLG
jgi:hypothetical protein